VNSRLLLLIVAVAGAVLGAFIVFSNEYANHAPAPHSVPIQAVAPADAVAQLQAGLAKAAPGGFSVTQAPSPAAAQRAILQQQADGAIIIGGQGPIQILTAGAQGPTLQLLVEKALSPAAAAAHRPLVVTDLVPLPSADHSGLSGFNFSLSLLLPGVIGSMLLYMAGRRSRVWWRVLAAVAYALLVSVAAILVLDAGFGALTGDIGAVFGIGVFGALTFVLFAFACQQLVGMAGTGIAALLFLFIGVDLNGSTTVVPLLPAVYRQISPWTPNGAIVRAVRAVTYFHANGIGQPLLTLGIWSAAALLLITASDLLPVIRRRAPSDRASSSYATHLGSPSS
jgi:hypothetical protein